ncbi:hypothetical protein RDWZM_008533 [Blomia tropicalis]|uniref:2'-phosphotransferase n=1 Tax=Blomia tropicalis TaxID=40697 RepID=A0A9Q0RLI1_BLOTA|nr:hypothetical protein RDWZM_008533 [Blomia tropicalis]
MPRTNSDTNPLTGKSKYISYLLRHDKRVGEIVDEHGFASLDQLNAIQRKDKRPLLSEDDLIAVTNNPYTKKRFEYEYRLVGNQNRSNSTEFRPKKELIYIRAMNGHSFPLKSNIFEPFILEDEPTSEKPKYFYHATNSSLVESIKREGLSPMARQFVHMYEKRSQVMYDEKRNTLIKIGPITSETLKQLQFYRSKNGYIQCPHFTKMAQLGMNWSSTRSWVVELFVLAILFTSMVDAYSSYGNYETFDSQSSFDQLLGGKFISYGSDNQNNDSCNNAIWCESNDFGNIDYNYDTEGSQGFWLDEPPDDIMYMPPPPMPPVIQAALFNMENISIKDFIINQDSNDREPLCNFCKIFADPRLYPSIDNDLYPDQPDDASYLDTSAMSKENDTFISTFYLLIFTAAITGFIVLILLIKYKKWKIFPISESCPILTSTGRLLGHHKSSSNSHGLSSSTRIPVVNEKSPQSIIMDAPLCASLVKKSTISTTGKYWKRIPNQNVTGGSNNIFSMEDRSFRMGLRSMDGTSSISDHPYSDAASCTSSPVYAELDPSGVGSCHTPTLIGPPGSGAGSIVSSFSPYAFSTPSNTYSDVPESLRGNHHHNGLSPAFHTDSSTYDNAAYLPASSQAIMGSGVGNYSTRSLRRLAAQRAASINASAVGPNQASIPLLAGHPYHHQPYHYQAQSGTLHPHQSVGNHQGQQQFAFLTGGRQLKKVRSGNGTQRPTNFYKRQTMLPNRMNHYVTQGSDICNGMEMMVDEQNIGNMGPPVGFSGFLNHHQQQDSSSNSSNRKSSSSSQTYTEMPLLNTSGTSSSYNHNQSQRIPETLSNNDLNSVSSCSSSGGSHNNASLKRPLPPNKSLDTYIRIHNNSL